MASKVVNLTIKLKDGVSGVLARIRGGIGRTATGFKVLSGIGVKAFKGLAVAGVASFGVLTAAALAVGKAVKTAFSFETAKVQLKALLGSMDAAVERFNELREFSAKTPFQLPGILKASRLLTVFSEGALGGAKSLEAIGDAAAVAGQDISDVAFWVGRAYSMLKGGKPFGEAAMRLQEMGILTAGGRDEIEKMVKAGASFEDTFARLEKELQRFKGGMKDLSATGDGLISTLKDNWTIAVATFGNAFMDAAKGGITTMIETIQRLVQDGTITKWAEQAKKALDLIAETAKIIVGVRGPEARVQLLGKIADLFKAAIMDGAEWASKQLGGAIDPSINTLGGMLGKLTADLGAWGFEFVKTLGSKLIEIAPSIGNLIADAFIGVAKSLFDKGITRDQARMKARDELGERPEQISGGLFKPPQNQAEIKKYYDDLEKLTEKYYRDALNEQKKSSLKMGKDASRAFENSFDSTRPPADPPKGPESSQIKDGIKDGIIAGTTPYLAALSGAVDEMEEPLTRTEKAIRALEEEIRRSMGGPLIDAQDTLKMSLDPSKMSGVDDAPKTPFVRRETEPFIDRAEDSQRFDGMMRMGGGPKMMGAGELGAKMMGQGISKAGLGKQGQEDFSAGAVGVDFSQLDQGLDLSNSQKFLKRKQERQRMQEVESLTKEGKLGEASDLMKSGGASADDIPGILTNIQSILNERLGGVEGGGE